MPEVVDVAISDLLLDSRNARLRDEQPSQQATALSLAEQQGARLVRLAEDIVKNGLDPTALPAIIPTPDQKKRYVILEGNRRVLALKALETPSLVTPALDSGLQKRFNRLADLYEGNPIESIACALFESEEAARHWVVLRHTGQNEGIGLVEWGADEKDRFAARHGTRSPAGQVLDFVDKHGSLSEAAAKSTTGIITSLKRLLNTPEVRERLGVEQIEGQLYSRFPAKEVAKGLSHVVEELKTGRVRVGDIYHAEQRQGYAKKLPKSVLPDPATERDEPLALSDLTTAPPPKRRPRRRRKPPAERTSVIPRNCHLDIDPPRINSIYNELLSLNLEQYPNACSVTLRVFVELSVDHYLDTKGLMSDRARRDAPLAKRLKAAATELKKQKQINAQLETAIKRVADSPYLLAASTVTFNQYVHNAYVYPKPNELRAAWDELQPFMEKLWP
jgi:hypothetical protein